MIRRFAVAIVRSGGSYSAHALVGPDGQVVATGETFGEARSNAVAAIRALVDAARVRGEPMPASHSDELRADYADEAGVTIVEIAISSPD